MVDENMFELDGKIEEKDLKNYVAIILDKSGSMMTKSQAAIDFFNSQVDAIQSNTGEMQTFVSLLTFNHSTDTLMWNVHANMLNKLTEYPTGGNTALYDAIGSTIQRLQSETVDDEKTSYLIIVITDGEENSSSNYDGKRLSSMIKELKDTNRWTFTILGSDIDVTELASAMNLDAGNVLYAAGGVRGLATANWVASKGSADYFKGRKEFQYDAALNKTILMSKVTDYYNSTPEDEKTNG